MNPSDFAPVNLAQIMAQGQQMRDQQDDRKMRLGELMARQQEQEAERQQQAEQRRRQSILQGAQIVREVNPTDDAGWQRALGAARQMGIEIEGVPRNFDPQYVQSLIAAANALSPQRNSERRPIVIDGVAIDPETGQPLFESPYDRIIPGPNGSFYRVPRIGIGRGGTGQPPQGQAVQGQQGGTLPPGWTVVEEDEGGPTPPASGNFPGEW